MATRDGSTERAREGIPHTTLELVILGYNHRVSIVKDVFTYDWYNGTPADYPLITEIDATNGFVELTNPTAKMLDLSGWQLTANAGAWSLPSGAKLPAGQTLVVTRDAAGFRAKFGSTVTPFEIKQLIFTQNGDTVRLKQGATTVDLVAWASARPGWDLPKAALCRPVAGKDTNTKLDWTRSERPSPGAAGCGS